MWTKKSNEIDKRSRCNHVPRGKRFLWLRQNLCPFLDGGERQSEGLQPWTSQRGSPRNFPAYYLCRLILSCVKVCLFFLSIRFTLFPPVTSSWFRVIPCSVFVFWMDENQSETHMFYGFLFVCNIYSKVCSFVGNFRVWIDYVKLKMKANEHSLLTCI